MKLCQLLSVPASLLHHLSTSPNTDISALVFMTAYCWDREPMYSEPHGVLGKKIQYLCLNGRCRCSVMLGTQYNSLPLVWPVLHNQNFYCVLMYPLVSTLGHWEICTHHKQDDCTIDLPSCKSSTQLLSNFIRYY